MDHSRLPIIIIGTGLAGITLAKEFRKLNTTQPLIFITQDDGHFYSKPQLSVALSLKKSPDDLIISSQAALSEQLSATFFTQSVLDTIDAENKTITFHSAQGQQQIRYGALVLAIGACPKPLPLLDSFEPHFRINHRLDYARFIQATPPSQTLALVGSGLVGCEFAHDFSHRYQTIHIITPDPYPLAHLVPSFFGEQLLKSLEEKGIHWHINTDSTQIKNKIEQLSVHTVVSAIGLKPNISLRSTPSLTVQEGIVVDDSLQTNLPEVYALGDCAQINGTCHQFVAPILQCARALAQTIAGQRTPVTLQPIPIALKVSSYPLIIMPPLKGMDGKWNLEIDKSNGKALFFDHHERLQGYILSGRFLEERQVLLNEFKQTASA